jgi:hypothetical protein
MWASKTPNGPSAKLHVQNIHTMDELKMTGNCLKGSRHLLSFDKAFDDVPHWGIMKELLGQVSVAAKGAGRWWGVQAEGVRWDVGAMEGARLQRYRVSQRCTTGVLVAAAATDQSRL